MAEKNAGQTIKGSIFIKHLTLFFGVFLLFTDVFFLAMGIIYDLPLIRYLIYVKLVVNSTNIYLILKKHYLVSTVIIYTVIMAMMIVGVISPTSTTMIVIAISSSMREKPDPCFRFMFPLLRNTIHQPSF